MRKKLLIRALCVILVFCGLTGCKDKGEDKEVNTTVEAASAATVIETVLVEETDFIGDTTIYEYDSNFRMILATTRDQFGDLKGTVEYTYDDNGNLIRSLDKTSLGNIYEEIIYTYDSKNNLISEATYDDEHNLTYEHTYTYTDKKDICEVIHTAFNHNRVKTESEITEYTKENKKVSYKYEIYDSKGDLTRYYIEKYNSEGIIYEHISYDKNGNTSCKKEYNSAGDITKSTSFKNDEITDIYDYVYDANGNLYQEIENGLICHEYAYDDTNFCTKKTSYNKLGNVTTTIEYTKNSKNQLIKSTTYLLDSVLNWYAYGYDEYGNQTKEVYYLSNGTLVNSTYKKYIPIEK